MIRSADLKYDFEKTCHILYKNLNNLKTNFETTLDNEFIKDSSANQNLYQIMRSFDTIEHGVAELVAHKSEFVFSGDITMLNSVFKGLGVDTNKMKRRANKGVLEAEDPESEVGKAIARLGKSIT